MKVTLELKENHKVELPIGKIPTVEEFKKLVGGEVTHEYITSSERDEAGFLEKIRFQLVTSSSRQEHIDTTIIYKELTNTDKVQLEIYQESIRSTISRLNGVLSIYNEVEYDGGYQHFFGLEEAIAEIHIRYNDRNIVELTKAI